MATFGSRGAGRRDPPPHRRPRLPPASVGPLGAADVGKLALAPGSPSRGRSSTRRALPSRGRRCARHAVVASSGARLAFLGSAALSGADGVFRCVAPPSGLLCFAARAPGAAEWTVTEPSDASAAPQDHDSKATNPPRASLRCGAEADRRDPRRDARRRGRSAGLRRTGRAPRVRNGDGRKGRAARRAERVLQGDRRRKATIVLVYQEKGRGRFGRGPGGARPRRRPAEGRGSHGKDLRERRGGIARRLRIVAPAQRALREAARRELERRSPVRRGAAARAGRGGFVGCLSHPRPHPR